MVDSPFQQVGASIFQRSGLVICRQDPPFRPAPAGQHALDPDERADLGTCPSEYVDITRRGILFDYTLDTPSDREPPYQFFGRKRLLMRVPLGQYQELPVACPGDTVQTTEKTKIPKRYLLANYDPVPYSEGGYGASVQYVCYEMDADAEWLRRECEFDPVTGLEVQEGYVRKGIIPVTLETLYEERDRTLVTKEDRRRVITGAPLLGNDVVRVLCSSDAGEDSVEMRIVRSEFISGIFACEAI